MSDMVDAVLSQQSATDPQTPSQPDAVDAVLSAASQLPLDRLMNDPAYASGIIHAKVLETNGQVEYGSDQRKLALVQAYRSLYGQRPSEITGGNSDLQAQLQSQAAGNSAVGNFSRSFANAFAQTGADILGIIAPETANEPGRKARETYNPDAESISGRLGNLAGGIVSTLPAVLTGTAVPVFAGLGAGAANREVSERNANGQNIGVAQRLSYMGEEAVIQGVVAHLLGEMTGGGMVQKGEGALTQTVPFQNFIRRLSPDLLKQIQGTDGQVLVPTIARTLLNMGAGAGQNEAAMIASEIAKSVTGITGAGDKDLVDRVLDQTSGTLLGGAAQALPFALHGELGKQGELMRGRVEEAPQDSVVEQGNAGSSAANTRITRFASETPDFLKEPESLPAGEDTKALPQKATDNGPAGWQLPVDQRANDTEELTTQLEKQARESDEVLGNMPKDQNKNAFTHPLVNAANAKSKREGREPDVAHAQISDDDVYQTVASLEKAQGLSIIPVKSETVGGYTHPDHPNQILFNVDNPSQSMQEVLGHEWAHNFMTQNPELAQKFLDTLPAARKAELESQYPGEITDKNRNQEIFATALGKAIAQDPEASGSNWNRLLRKDPSLWQKIKDVGTALLNSFTAKGREMNGVRKLLAANTDIKINEGPEYTGGEGNKIPSQAVRKNLDTLSRQGLQELHDWITKNTGDEYGLVSPRVAPSLLREINFRANNQGEGSERAASILEKYLSSKTFEPMNVDSYLGGGNQLPTKNYLSIGHKNQNVELWGTDEDNNILTAKNQVHVERPDLLRGDYRGRIDHDSKEVSVTGPGKYESDPVQSRAYEMGSREMAEKLQSKYPDYTVYVDGRGGTVPLQEAQDGNFMLRKLKNIRSAADSKDELNKETPENEPHMTMTAEDKLRRAALDEQWPVVKYIRGMVGKLNDVSKLSPEAFVRRVAGFREMRGQQMKHGLRDENGAEVLDQKTGENMTERWLVDPVAKSAKDLGLPWTEVQDHAHSFMVATRTVEKAKIRQEKGESMEPPISGIGEGKPGLLSGPPRKNTGTDDLNTAIDFLKTIKQSPAFDAINEYARRLRLWGNEHLRLAVNSGITARESAARMLDDNQFYVNMQKVMDREGTFEEGDYSGPYAHRFRGSNRENDNPLGNTLQSTEMIAKKAQINYAKQKIIELAKQVGDTPAQYVEPGNPAARKLGPAGNFVEGKPGKDAISVFENGEKKFYKTTPDVAAAVEGWGKTVPPAFSGWLSVPGRIKAFGTLVRPVFRLNHLMKQTQNRLMLSENSGIADTLKMFDPDTKELLGVLGGTMGHERDYGSSSSDYLNLISKTMDKLTGKDPNMILGLPKKLWDGYQNLGEWSDAANRIAEFKGSFEKAKRNGMSDLDAQNYAAWKARDLMDFGIAGTVVKQVNKIMYQPFMNAELQGWNKMYSMIRERPAQAAVRLALYGLIPSMIPYFWAKSQGKEAEDRYIDTPLAQRIMFNQFQVGDYRIMVPKGQTQAMACALWEAFLDKHRGDPMVWGKAMADSGLIPRQLAGMQGLESMLPFQGFREAQSNWNWFYDRHIIPPDQEGVALDSRHTDGASGLGQMISNMIKGTGEFVNQKKNNPGWEYDPRKIDHVLATDLGTSGIDLETGSNLVAGKAKPLAAQAAAGFGYVRLPPGYTSQSVQDSMTNAQRYKDTGSPQYKAVQDLLGKSYQATSASERNAFVDQARAAADQANEFYRKYGDQMIAAKEVSSKINAATTQYEAQGSLAARTAWVKANPGLADLARKGSDLSEAQGLLAEARKVLASPRVSPAIRKAAEERVANMLDAISRMGNSGK